MSIRSMSLSSRTPAFLRIRRSSVMSSFVSAIVPSETHVVRLKPAPASLARIVHTVQLSYMALCDASMETIRSPWAGRFIGLTFMLGGLAWVILAILVLGNVLVGLGNFSGWLRAPHHRCRRRRSKRRLRACKYPESNRGPDRGPDGNRPARLPRGRDCPRERLDGRPPKVIL